MPRACSQCGCTDIDTDAARGDAVCTNCGTVLEDQIIVSEVQFQESGAGGASMIGQFVSNDGTRANNFKGGMLHGGFNAEDSRRVTLENGYKRLKEMGHKLRMHMSSIETAFGFFKIAVAQRFTRGRKMEYVLASCLYLVCRVDPGGSEDLELMLIDFSDMLRVCVSVLGRTFVQLAAELCQNIRIVDPIIYIRRFANQLNFGNKLNKVVESATRLVARMKRDWMHTGRRPAGLCGAALLISARMHNFNRTVDQIIKVVKVCESTVRKRLLEFDSTPSAQLTIEEFDNVDLEDEMDPPCFTQGKIKAKLANLTEGKIPESTVKDLNKLSENINKSLKRKTDTASGDIKQMMSDPDKAVKLMDEEVAREAAGDDWRSGEWEGLGEGHRIIARVEQDLNESGQCSISVSEKGAEGEDVKGLIAKVEKVEDGELDLTGIDDEEIDKMINTEEETANKAQWFDAEFGDFMVVVQQREEKRRIKEEAAAAKKEKTPKAKKKKKTGYDLETELAQCMEILKKDIQEKRFSDKINYSVLNNLDTAQPCTIGVSEVSEVDQALVKEEPTPQVINRFSKPSFLDSRSQIKITAATKRAREEEVTAMEPVAKVKVIEEEEEVIMQEVRPVGATGEPELIEDDEDDEDDYNEEEEEVVDAGMLTARQLLGQEEDDDVEEDDDDYYD